MCLPCSHVCVFTKYLKLTESPNCRCDISAWLQGPVREYWRKAPRIWNDPHGPQPQTLLFPRSDWNREKEVGDDDENSLEFIFDIFQVAGSSGIFHRPMDETFIIQQSLAGWNKKSGFWKFLKPESWIEIFWKSIGNKWRQVIVNQKPSLLHSHKEKTFFRSEIL